MEYAVTELVGQVAECPELRGRQPAAWHPQPRDVPIIGTVQPQCPRAAVGGGSGRGHGARSIRLPVDDQMRVLPIRGTVCGMGVVEWLAELGGLATWGTLVRLTSRPEVEAAVAGGEIVKVGRGRYVLASVHAAKREAHRLSGTVSHASAALLWGWEVKQVPALPDVTVPKGRKVSLDRRRGVRLHRAELLASQVVDGVTSQDQTLLQCLRQLPFDEALAIADSALRDGFGQQALLAIGDLADGPGAPQVRRVAQAATARAANPFESVLRAIAMDVPGLSVQPQVEIGGLPAVVRPDLVDERLRIVLEADSFEWHGGRDELARDARRYNLLVVNGWLVLRFAWEDVMHDPAYVSETLTALVALAEGRTKVTCNCAASA